MKLLIVVGTRPNFVKITQFLSNSGKDDDIEISLVHTGQHYDDKMSDIFLSQFGLEPDYWLDVGQDSPSFQIAKVISGLEKVLSDHSPDLVMVVGDVNSTLAAAIAANKNGIKVAHLESGLRSNDRTMPEEINRLVVDHIADYLFVTEQSGIDNLAREGIPKERIFLVGNTMIDTLVAYDQQIQESRIREDLMIDEGYGLVTLHRPSNVDNREDLTRIIELLNVAAHDRKIVFPIHPRTAKQLKEFGLEVGMSLNKNIILCEPFAYFDFQHLLLHAQFVITDSGGIQEEATFRQKPCLTLRPNTERPVTVGEGTNVLCEFTPDVVLAHIDQIDSGRFKRGKIPALWDGKATQRVMQVIKEL